MNDYVYSIKRLLDPRIASSHSWLFEGKIVGLDDLTAKAKKPENLNYEAKVEGIEVLDKYTLRLHLTRPDFNLPMILAYVATSAVAREVVEQYQDLQGLVMANPVGTGPTNSLNGCVVQKWFWMQSQITVLLIGTSRAAAALKIKNKYCNEREADSTNWTHCCYRYFGRPVTLACVSKR